MHITEQKWTQKLENLLVQWAIFIQVKAQSIFLFLTE